MIAERTVRALALRAFMDGEAVRVSGRGAELSWTIAGGQSLSMRFEHLFFDPEQNVFINVNGYADRNSLSVVQAGRRRELALNGWLDGR